VAKDAVNLLPPTNLLPRGTVGVDRLHTEANLGPETVFARVFYAASQAMSEVLGNPQPPWDELPAWQQQAMTDVTRRCIMGAAPQQLHALWVQHYTAQGWTYGPKKNRETKQHPVITPWHKLSLPYQARFKLWQAIVMTLMLEIPEYSSIRS
jgi:hypothetical protein